jgi:hypothetical protein
LECSKWSPHHDWYHDYPPIDLEEITEETAIEEGA